MRNDPYSVLHALEDSFGNRGYPWMVLQDTVARAATDVLHAESLHYSGSDARKEIVKRLEEAFTRYMDFLDDSGKSDAAVILSRNSLFSDLVNLLREHLPGGGTLFMSSLLNRRWSPAEEMRFRTSILPTLKRITVQNLGWRKWRESNGGGTDVALQKLGALAYAEVANTVQLYFDSDELAIWAKLAI